MWIEKRWKIIKNNFFNHNLVTFIVEACIIELYKVKQYKNYGAKMGIHYTYKSIRGEKAMKKEAKRKARLEQRRAKKGSKPIESENEKMHDIEKTITLEDLTNPNKN